jgi:hypothetical protein
MFEKDLVSCCLESFWKYIFYIVRGHFEVKPVLSIIQTTNDKTFERKFDKIKSDADKNSVDNNSFQAMH